MNSRHQSIPCYVAVHYTHKKSTDASVIRLNIKALMHCEAFSSDDHNNDKERNYAKQNAIYTSLDNFFFHVSYFD